MAEYIDREALMRRIKEIHCAECDSYHGVRCRACWVDDTLDYIDSEPAADVEKMSDGYHTFADLYEQRLILSAALAKIIRMHGKASGMRTAAFLSAGDGSSWVLTPTKDVTHTTMS